MNKQPRPKKVIEGYRPAVYARQGIMLAIRQPLDGPVFEKLHHAEAWCIDVIADHYDRRLGMSDARIEPFKGMVARMTPPPHALLRDVIQICESVQGEPRITE